MHIRLYILALFALAMATFLLFHFGLIWVFGRFYIAEPNHLVLILETVTIAGILGFSFYCLIEQLRSIKRPVEKQRPDTKSPHLDR
jgi:hypothetical protein